MLVTLQNQNQGQTRVRPESGALWSDTLVSMTSWSLTPLCQWHCVVRILYVYTILPQCRTCSKIFWHIKKKSTGASHTRMFTLFVYGSSCNSLCFGLIPSSFLFPSTSCLVFRSSFGMPINWKRKAKKQEWGFERHNYMNCRPHKNSQTRDYLTRLIHCSYKRRIGFYVCCITVL